MKNSIQMDSPVIIIAEAGVNHNGDIAIAKQLIDAASEAGADYVKFQTWITDDIVDILAPKAKYQLDNDGKSSQYEMLKRLELSFDDFRVLQNYAHKRDIGFLSTPDDGKSLNFLTDDLELQIIKIGSGEVTNLMFLRKIGSKKKEVILSTGMSTMDEVELAFNSLIDAGAPSVSLLHCTSSYPAAYDSVNLTAMLSLRKKFGVLVGYSDHTLGNEVSLAAVALGAKIIEKHFTLDKSMKGPDHKASLDIPELKKLVSEIRNVETALSGDGQKEPHESEYEIKRIVSKGIYMAREVPKGTVLTEDLLIMKRPVQEIAADQCELVLGKRVRHTLSRGHSLKLDDIVK